MQQTSSQAPNKFLPVIDLGNVILREKCDADAEDFFRYYSDPEVNKFILCEIPQNLEEARLEVSYWRNVFYRGDGAYFAIANKNNNQLIGSIGLTGLNNLQRRIELSYDLASQYWRQGIMLKAIKAVVAYGFNELGVNRIEASVSTSNIPSKNLLLKCGFTLEGILRQHRFHRGQFVDVYFFSLLREEFND